MKRYLRVVQLLMQGYDEPPNTAKARYIQHELQQHAAHMKAGPYLVSFKWTTEVNRVWRVLDMVTFTCTFEFPHLPRRTYIGKFVRSWDQPFDLDLQLGRTRSGEYAQAVDALTKSLLEEVAEDCVTSAPSKPTTPLVGNINADTTVIAENVDTINM